MGEPVGSGFISILEKIMITNEHIEEFLKQAHRVGDAGLTVCSSGNLSWRVGEEVLVSGTGSWVPSLTRIEWLCAVWIQER